ncbi:MAG: Hsp20/alpha crystallin family protein [Nitrospiraceae bacterium]|nr:MAG: Hsp20/alpha crystallin family protein [Nitrospiraceae bacterium]
MAETVKDIKITGEGNDQGKKRKTYAPAVDIIETKNNILLIADMPGVDEKSVDITLEKNLLTVYGMIAPAIPDYSGTVTDERSAGDYQRVFRVSDEIDRENIKATVKDGVLRLVLPRGGNVMTKKIEVTGEA